MKQGIFTFSVFFLLCTTHAQVSNTFLWTWVNGDIGSNSVGVYGTKGTAAPANKPGGREGTGMNWTDTSGNLWLFGGFGYASASNGLLNDLWKYDPLANQWTWMSGDNTPNNTGIYGTIGVAAAGNKPGARYLSATWVDSSNNLWLFGGSGYSSAASGALNDLWKYNIASGQWTWISGDNAVNSVGIYGTRGLGAPSNKPSGRNRVCRPFPKADTAGNLWLFGGSGYAATLSYGELNDLWKYNINSGNWTWISGDNSVNNLGVYGTMGTAAAANKPGARLGAVSWTDTAGKFWLCGGGYDNGGGWTYKLSDLWKYDPATDMWTWMKGDNTFDHVGIYGTMGTTSSGSNPGGRLMAECFIDNYNNFWLLGGYGFSSSAVGNEGLNDLWKYDPPTNNWTWMNGSSTGAAAAVYGTMGVAAAANVPGNRSAGESWLDKYGNFWLFGGLQWTPAVFKNDLWKFVIPQPVAKGRNNNCIILPGININATNNNIWVPIFDSIGNIAAEINANGNNLGNVNTKLFTKTGACREDVNYKLYLNRNITISPQTQPSSAVSVRLYILKAELDSIKTATTSQNQPSGVASINEIDVFKNDDSCMIVGGNLAYPLAATNGTYNTDYYLQVSVNSFSSFYFANKALAVLLPLKLEYFTGKKNGTNNLLSWKTGCSRTTNFIIERSTDGRYFESIGTMSAGAWNCVQPFSFIDPAQQSGTTWYRLIIKDNNLSSLSPVIVMPGNTDPLLLSMAPTIVTSAIANINTSSTIHAPLFLFISDLQGRRWRSWQITVQPGTNTTQADLNDLPPGAYLLSGIYPTGKTNTVKFIKQ